MARVTLTSACLTGLPSVCVCCGAPATRTRPQEFRLDGALSAATLAASVLAGGLAWTEKSLSLSLPVCEYHKRRGRKSNKTFFQGMALTAACAGAAYVASFFDGKAVAYLAVLAAITFMATLFAGMHEVDDGLKVKVLPTGELALTGVSRPFADACGQAVGASPR